MLTATQIQYKLVEIPTKDTMPRRAFILFQEMGQKGIVLISKQSASGPFSLNEGQRGPRSHLPIRVDFARVIDAINLLIEEYAYVTASDLGENLHNALSAWSQVEMQSADCDDENLSPYIIAGRGEYLMVAPVNTTFPSDA